MEIITTIGIPDVLKSYQHALFLIFSRFQDQIIRKCDILANFNNKSLTLVFYSYITRWEAKWKALDRRLNWYPWAIWTEYPLRVSYLQVQAEQK